MLASVQIAARRSFSPRSPRCCRRLRRRQQRLGSAPAERCAPPGSPLFVEATMQPERRAEGEHRRARREGRRHRRPRRARSSPNSRKARPRQRRPDRLREGSRALAGREGRVLCSDAMTANDFSRAGLIASRPPTAKLPGNSSTTRPKARTTRPGMPPTRGRLQGRRGRGPTIGVIGDLVVLAEERSGLQGRGRRLQGRIAGGRRSATTTRSPTPRTAASPTSSSTSARSSSSPVARSTRRP